MIAIDGPCACSPQPRSSRYVSRGQKVTLLYVKFSRNRARLHRKPADLVGYELSGGMSVQFECQPKSPSINMRVPKPLLDAVRERAKARSLSDARLIRPLMEREVSGRRELQR